ncbi:MAG: hypothetical protein BYD32DRAFT_465546 [Podila humilis]|nr:MAG: hypothetical protein BYD32DRAFT_465546 [Podila humilis]
MKRDWVLNVEGVDHWLMVEGFHARDADERYVLWDDIQRAFQDIDNLETTDEKRVLFMVDSDSELWNPLRIEHNPNEAYVAVYRRFQGQSQLAPRQHHKENDHFLAIHSAIDSSHSQNTFQGQLFVDFVPSLDHLFDTYFSLYKYLQTAAKESRDPFLQAAFNTRYHYSMLMEKLKRLGQAGATALVEGKNQAQLLEELRDLRQKVSLWDYQNTCCSIWNNKSAQWDYGTSPLVINLPADSASWDDTDPSTHQTQPQAATTIFQIYGEYVLRVLQMIRRDYTSNEYDVPSLDAFKILWNCDPDLIGSHVTKDNIRYLVAKAVAYLQELTSPKWTSGLGLSRSQSAMINAYLDVQNGDNEESNLYRYIDSDRIVFWKCQAHAHQYLNLDSLERLQFSCGRGGYVNMQKV